MSGADWFLNFQEFALTVFGPALTYVAILAVAVAMILMVVIVIHSVFTK